MSITKPYTFQPNTKARANEVNANFDTLYSQANTNISNIEANARDIDELNDTKAELNGDSTQRFAVADPVNDTDAINKQTMLGQLAPTIDYIGGLTIAKDSSSPNDTIIVSSGSCYDSTKKVVLSLANSTSKKNTTQAASTTYYVHIVGNSTGSSTNIIISNDSISPTLPSGYTLYRLIGYYTTDSNRNIQNIFYLNNSSIFRASNVVPDYSNVQSRSVNTNYIAKEPGWVYVYAMCYNANTVHYYINDVAYVLTGSVNGDTDTAAAGAWFMVDTGDKYSLSTNGAQAYYGIKFFPLKGGN